MFEISDTPMRYFVGAGKSKRPAPLPGVERSLYGRKPTLGAQSRFSESF